MAFELPIQMETTLSVRFLDAAGNPAVVDGVPTWQVDNPSVGALTPAADGMSCILAAVGPIGSGTVSVQADADLGQGVRLVVGVFQFQVTAGEAVTVQVTASPPTGQ